MDKDIWGAMINELDDATGFYSTLTLHPKILAKRFTPFEGHKLDHKLMHSAQAKNLRTYYPRIEGIEDSINEALYWMRNPPPMLRTGLLALTNDETVDNVASVVAMYGKFKAHLGVLEARDPDFAGFVVQRAAGRKADHKMNRFAASFLLAAMQKNKADVKFGRMKFLEYVKGIVFKYKPLPKGFKRSDFKELLECRPLKPGQNEETASDFKESFLKKLTGPKLEEWADEILILKLQEYALRP